MKSRKYIIRAKKLHENDFEEGYLYQCVSIDKAIHSMSWVGQYSWKEHGKIHVLNNGAYYCANFSGCYFSKDFLFKKVASPKKLSFIINNQWCSTIFE